MSPRLLTLLATLTAAVAAAPATALAAPSACGVDPGPYAPAAQDQTVVADTGWQVGSPPGTVDIPLAGTDVDAFEYKVDCGAPIHVEAASGTATVSGQGGFRFTHRARDVVTGDWTDWVDEFVLIDSVSPSNTTPLVSTSWRKGPASLPVTGTDATSPVHTEWRVDGGSWTTGASALVAGSGAHTLETAAVDAAGNRDERTDTVNIDDAAPVDTTDDAPAGWQDEPVYLTVDGTDAHSGVDHVEWQLDAQAPGSGPDGTIVPIATQGQHVFRTRVVDEVGNVSAWRVQDVWVDIDGPVDTTVVPSAWFTTPTAAIDITAADDDSGIKSIEYRLDGGGVVYTAADTVPVTISGDGVHELEVRVTDNEDRVLDWHTHLVKIDTVHPVDTTTVAAGWLPYSSLNVNVRGTDSNSGIARVEWRIDGGDVESATTGSHDVTVAGDGAHTIETRVVDAAGLASAWTARTVKLDATAPTNLTPVAPTGWRNTPYTVTFNGSDAGSGVAAVGYRLGAGDEVLRAPGTSIAIDEDGSHTLATRVHDVAGTASGWRTEQILIDRVAPTDETVYPTGTVGNRHVIAFAPADDRSGVAGVEWRLDGGAARTTPSATITGAGEHALAVRVRDNAGNWSDWAEHQVEVVLGTDTTAPTDTTAIPSQWLTAAYTVTVAATDDADGVGVDYVEWRVDDEAIESGPAGSTFTVSADGAHAIDTRAWDKAGNHSAWTSQTLRIDRTRPQDTSALGTGWSRTRTLTLSATDAASGVERITYAITGAATASGTITGASGSVTLPADGEYALTYSVFDVAGQRTNRIGTYKVDTVVPVNTSAAAPTGWRSAFALPLSGTDARSGVDRAEWRVDGGETQTGGTATVTSEGAQKLETRIVDRAGNASAWRVETIKVDGTEPSLALDCGPDAWRDGPVTCAVSASGGASGLAQLTANGAPITDAYTVTAAGVTSVVVQAVDGAGNAATATAEVKIGSDPAAAAPTPTPTPTPAATPTPTPVTPATVVSEAVLLRKGAGSRLLGQLAVKASATKTSIDLRPLALGKGRFQLVLKIRAGKKSRTVRRTQTTRSGYSTRIRFSVPLAGSPTVTLTVRKRSGKRWVAYASGSAKVA